jgi:hypothetical protein
LDREKALKAWEKELETRRNSAAPNGSVEEGGSQTTIKPTTQTIPGMGIAATETAPLLQHSFSDPSPQKYGTGPNSSSGSNSNISSSQAISPLTQSADPSKRKLISRLIPFSLYTRLQNTSLVRGVHNVTEPSESHSTHTLLPVEEVSDSPTENGGAGLQNGNGRRGGIGKEELMIEHGNESDYLKSKLWYVYNQ